MDLVGFLQHRKPVVALQLLFGPNEIVSDELHGLNWPPAGRVEAAKGVVRDILLGLVDVHLAEARPACGGMLALVKEWN